MRIPLATSLQSRDGGLSKDAKVLNGLVEVQGEGEGAKLKLRKRPGLLDRGLIRAGVAQAATFWDEQIVTIQDDHINLGTLKDAATWNSADKGSGVTLSGSDLIASVAANSSHAVRATISKTSGKWYWEVTATTLTTINFAAGVANASYTVSSASDALGAETSGNSTAVQGANDNILFDGASIGTMDVAQGDVLGFALDMDARTLAFYKNGTLVETAASAELPAGALFPAVGGNGNANATVLTANFGASAFTHSVPSGFNAGFYATDTDAVWVGTSTNLSPDTADLPFNVQDNGQAAAKLYLMVKNAEQAWSVTDTGTVAEITDADYPGSYTVTLTSLTRSGTTATATTAADTNFRVGDSVTIAGAAQSDYNGAKTILTVTPSSSTEYPSVPVASITRSGTTATVTTEEPHGLENGQSVVIEGADQTEYNGTFTITWISATSFSFTVTVTSTSSPATPATGSPAVSAYYIGQGAFNAYTNYTGDGSIAGSTPLIGGDYQNFRFTALNPHGLSNGDTVNITLAGDVTISNVSTFTFDFTISGVAYPRAGGGAKVVSPLPTISSLTRSGTTVTVTTSAAHKLQNEDVVTITGCTQTPYNGTFFRVRRTSTTTFTYELPDDVVEDSIPATPATGTISAHRATTAVGATFTFAVANSPVTPATGTITAQGSRTTVPGLPYIDGYFLVMDERGVIYNSGENDPTSWNALDYISALEESGEGVAIARSRRFVVALKEWSSEFFINQPDPNNPFGSPFVPVQSLSSTAGCAQGWSVAEVSGRLFWIAQSKRAKGRSVYMMVGSEQQKVSSEDVDRILNADDLDEVHAYGVTIDGHPCYVLSLVTSDITLVYDLLTQAWTQWSTLTLGSSASITSITRSDTTATVTFAAAHGLSDGDPVLIAGANQADYNGIKQVNRSSATVVTFHVENSPTTPATGTITGASYTESYFKFTKYAAGDGKDLVLHASDGHLYEVRPSLYQDDGIPINLFARTERLGSTGRQKMSRISVIGDTVSDAAMVRWSDDDSASFSTYRRVDLSDPEPNTRRCGAFQRRTLEYRHIGNTAPVLEGLEVEVSQ